MYILLKKCILISFLFLFVVSLFAERIPSEYADYEYVNKDGTPDWKTFYDEWDTVPDTYYMYLDVYASNNKHGVKPQKMLAKTVGDFILQTSVDHTHDTDVHFIIREWTTDTSFYNIELIFSLVEKKALDNWIPFGQKRHNYADAIERWNFIIKQYERKIPNVTYNRENK